MEFLVNELSQVNQLYYGRLRLAMTRNLPTEINKTSGVINATAKIRKLVRYCENVILDFNCKQLTIYGSPL